MFGGKQTDEDLPLKSDISTNGKPETIIGSSVKVDGQLKGEGDVIIEGQVKGSIKTGQTVRIGRDAKIKANIDAGSAYVSGEVVGNIRAKAVLSLTASARVHGDLSAKILSIEPGAQIKGQIKMEVEGLDITHPIAELEMPEVIKNKTERKTTAKKTIKKGVES